jgi:hypothetical protein
LFPPELEKIKESFSNLRKQSNEIVRNNVEYRRKNAVLEQETQNLKDENILLSSRNVQLVAELEKWRAKPTGPGNNEENKVSPFSHPLAPIPFPPFDLVCTQHTVPWRT